MALVAKGVFTSPVVLSGINGKANDGVAVAGPGERWLVVGNAHDNGLYETSLTDWQRVPELDESSDFVWGMENTIVRVRQGNRYGRSVWGYNGADNPIVGADTLYFDPVHIPTDAVDDAPLESYIEGLGLYYVDATTVGLSPGRAYVPSLGKVLTVGADQTATRLAGNYALYYGYLEEYPAGSGLGRLRLTTTEPGTPYLGSAATQSDDSTVRYLGMLKNTGAGNLLPFETEVQGGGTVLVLYNGPQGIGAVSGTTLYETDIGPDAATLTHRLVSPFARTAYVSAVRQSGTDAADVGWRPDSVNTQIRVLGGKDDNGAVFCRLSPAQSLRYQVGGGTTTVAFEVFGYSERR